MSASSQVDIDLALLRPHLQLRVDTAAAREQTYVSCDDRSGGETLAVLVCEEARANTVTATGKRSPSSSSVCRLNVIPVFLLLKLDFRVVLKNLLFNLILPAYFMR